MKRLILFVALGVLATGVALSQSFGIKAGLNFTNLPSTETGSTSDYIVSAFSDSYTGFHLGVTSLFVFRGGFIQPELLYSQTGRDMRIEYLISEEEDEYFQQKFSHIVLPLQAGAKFGPLKIGAGPVFSYLINDWNDLKADVELENILNRLTLGYQLGAGLQLGSLMLDFRYEGNLTKFREGITIGGQNINFDTRPQQYILSLGLLF